MLGAVAAVQHGQDAFPNAHATPQLIATMHRLPRTEMSRYLPPRRTGLHHPEHAREHHSVVVRRATNPRRPRRKQRCDARPSFICQFEYGSAEHLRRWDIERDWLSLCPSRRVAASRDRLMFAPEGGPGKVEGEALRWLIACEQQPANLRHRERDQTTSPSPFFSALALAVCRVTSR